MAIATITLGTSTGTLYTSTVSGSQIGNAITCMIICNYSASSANLTLYAVPNNAGAVGTAGTSNIIVSALTIPAGETVSLDQEKLVLSSNDTIQGFSSAASSLTLTISTLPV